MPNNDDDDEMMSSKTGSFENCYCGTFSKSDALAITSRIQHQ